VARPQNWCNFATGTSGTHYGASFALHKEVRTELAFTLDDQPADKALFDTFQKEQVAIEREFGEPLRWERLEERIWSRIAAYRPGSIENDAETLQEIHAWAIDRLLRFKKVFGPRLQRLT
jgi:hypothetical protein